jgi:hypothetical protein
MFYVYKKQFGHHIFRAKTISFNIILLSCLINWLYICKVNTEQNLDTTSQG